ncbi:hypothetical protein KQX54_016444 [Cotesia glomerata]|uniref:Uncharacterized protein n=1 Tax=Cotesia glomerata TaxID=32391 RepID=A0AAV7HTK3_COTGL|nr:hypothetical protein KQX54_016444 [Cotesia glomerata]
MTKSVVPVWNTRKADGREVEYEGAVPGKCSGTPGAYSEYRVASTSSLQNGKRTDKSIKKEKSGRGGSALVEGNPSKNTQSQLALKEMKLTVQTSSPSLLSPILYRQKFKSESGEYSLLLFFPFLIFFLFELNVWDANSVALCWNGAPEDFLSGAKEQTMRQIVQWSGDENNKSGASVQKGLKRIKSGPIVTLTRASWEHSSGWCIFCYRFLLSSDCQEVPPCYAECRMENVECDMQHKLG